MAITGANFDAVGEFNATVLLDAIRRSRSGISRSGLSHLTGLSAMTVSKVCRQLIDRKLVTESTAITSGRGKPPRILHLNPAMYSVGVHIDPAEVALVLVDLSGAVHGHVILHTSQVQDPSAIVSRIADAVHQMLAKAGVSTLHVLGLGIATPGPIDPGSGMVMTPPMLPKWHHFDLRARLGEATGFPVLLEKDSTAAVVAELWFADADSRQDWAFLYYGTGFALGAAIGGAALRGVSSNAGDAGHITVDPTGPVCWCGRRGCVGNMAVPRALVEKAVRTGLLAPPRVGELNDAVRVDQAFTLLCDAATAGDSRAVQILTEASRQLAHAVVVVANFLDIDAVVLGGPAWSRIAATALPVLPEAVQDDPALVLPHQIDFTESRIPVDVPAVGAATLVLDASFSTRPSSLLLPG